MWSSGLKLIFFVLFVLGLTIIESKGSSIAEVKQFPYQVALISQSNWCGGVLISKDWILTSAQCIEGATRLTAILGGHDVTKDEDSQIKLEIALSDVYLHEDWDRSTLLHDIAAVGLPRSVQFTDHIKPVTLPLLSYAEFSFEGIDATTSGWSYGNTNELRFGIVNIGKQSDCSAYFHNGEIESSTVCVNTMEDICLGDLGSPLVLKDVSKTLLGLASNGWGSKCRFGELALFTRITSYIRWIYETTGVINNQF